MALNVKFSSKVMLDNTDAYPYIATIRDCDDMAYILLGSIRRYNRGLVIGVMYMQREHGAHAVNFFLDNNLTIWIIEPITDSIYRWNEIKEIWRPYVVIIT